MTLPHTHAHSQTDRQSSNRHSITTRLRSNHTALHTYVKGMQQEFISLTVITADNEIAYTSSSTNLSIEMADFSCNVLFQN